MPIKPGAEDTQVQSQEKVNKQMATLIHPDTQARQAVEVGSQDAQKLFGQGYVLEQSPGIPVKGATQAGTGRVTTGKPATSAGKFVELVNKRSKEKVQKKQEEILNAPDSYDQILEKRYGALTTALLDGATALTPENLRWLDPAQQAAVRDGNINLLKTARAGTTAEMQMRSNRKKEEEATKEREEAKRLAQAETTFNLYSKYGMWDKLSEEQKIDLETTLGLPTGTVASLDAAAQETPGGAWELRSTDQGLTAVYLDPATGETKFNVVVPAKATGDGTTGVGGSYTGTTFGSAQEEINFNDPNIVAGLPISDLTKSVIAGYGTVKDLTPTDKALVSTELYKVGYDPKKNILNRLDALAVAYNNLPGGAKGIIEGRLSPNFVREGGQQAAQFDSAKNVLTRIVARLNDVGMLSDQDVLSYNQAMPSRSDRNSEIVQGKVNGLKSAIGIVTPQANEEDTRIVGGRTYVKVPGGWVLKE